jgi:alkylation response protein AidB-like acyl-CoA dehydrogenase
MDLELSEEEADLRDNVRAVLESICPPSAVRATFEGKGDPAPIWARMVELDWPALAVPERLGGLGMGFVEVSLVAEELGRAVAPGPFLATVTQFAPLVREVGADTPLGADLLSRVAAGSVTGTVALGERGLWDPAAVRTSARQTADGWTLAGTKSAVLDAAHADEVLVVARESGTSGVDGVGVFAVPAATLASTAGAVTPRPAIDPTLPLADVRVDGVVVPADRVLASPGTAGVAHALDRAGHEATVAMATATVGACRVIFERTLEYAKVREQYGRPIGSFQAIKHRLAEMYVAVERATALCYFAALTIAEDDPRRAEAASMAKAAAGECQQLVAKDGVQLHGGIGVTWENDLHFHVKRAISGDALYGNAVHHRARLAEMLGLVPRTGEVPS